MNTAPKLTKPQLKLLTDVSKSREGWNCSRYSKTEQKLVELGFCVGQEDDWGQYYITITDNGIDFLDEIDGGQS